MFGNMGTTGLVGNGNLLSRGGVAPGALGGSGQANLPGFLGKRKRSEDINVSNVRPMKQAKTSGRGFGALPEIKVAAEPGVPSSFLQPLPSFAPATGATIPDDVFQKPQNGQVSFNKKPSAALCSNSSHPAAELCQANTKIGNLASRIRRLEEQNQYWRRKSLGYSQENASIRRQIDKMKAIVSRVEGERVAMQTKLMRAESNSASCLKEIESLMNSNAQLMGTVSNLNEEAKMVSSVQSQEVVVGEKNATPDHVAKVEKALMDTLSDLTDKVEEIEQLKKAMASASAEKSRLDEVVTRNTILSEMIDMEENANDDQKDSEGSPELAKIASLQIAVAKCMARITQLSDRSEAYKAVIREARESHRPPSSTKSESIIHALQPGQKVHILESLCMQRYRLLLREAAESLVGQDVGMNESF